VVPVQVINSNDVKYVVNLSLDVSRYDGSYEHVFEAHVAGVTLQTPQLDIHTVNNTGIFIVYTVINDNVIIRWLLVVDHVYSSVMVYSMLGPR
jgi:hypothetical protein